METVRGDDTGRNIPIGGDRHGRRPESRQLLAEYQGKWEVEIVRIKRMVKQWQAEEWQYHKPQNTGNIHQRHTGSKNRDPCSDVHWRATGLHAPSRTSGHSKEGN